MRKDNKFQVIYADPPWSYDNKKTGGSMKSGAANKYPTMTVSDICALKVPSDKNSVLFLWVTVPMLQEGIQVMKAWGFKYKTMITWEKTGRVGLGYWYRGQTEHLLFGVKGKIKAFRRQEPNIIHAPVEAHSKKPKVFRDMIERATILYPAKLEMFAREENIGWQVWGNEVNSNVEILKDYEIQF